MTLHISLYKYIHIYIYTYVYVSVLAQIPLLLESPVSLRVVASDFDDLKTANCYVDNEPDKGKCAANFCFMSIVSFD